MRCGLGLIGLRAGARLRAKVSKGLQPAQRAPKAHTEEKERGPPSSHWPSLAYSGAPRQVLGQLGGGGGGGCDGGDGELDDERTPVTSQTMNISDCQTLPKSVILCSMHSAQRGMRAVGRAGQAVQRSADVEVPSVLQVAVTVLQVTAQKG